MLDAELELGALQRRIGDPLATRELAQLLGRTLAVAELFLEERERLLELSVLAARRGAREVVGPQLGAAMVGDPGAADLRLGDERKADRVGDLAQVRLLNRKHPLCAGLVARIARDDEADPGRRGECN